MNGGGLEGPQLTRNYTELVRDELIERYGANTVLQGGLSVYTTLDLRAQEAAQETLYGEEGYLSGAEDPDAALVSLEPETGKVRAMIGNRDQSSQFNLVTQAQRQPGSSFKPFALVAALEQGIDRETEFVSEDKEYELDHGFEEAEEWRVENYGGTERGPISLQEALWQSDNTVFTDLATNAGGRGIEDGPETIADVAERLGVSAEIDTDHPSMVLGAQEVSPMDMAKAYATIANYGRTVEPQMMERVVRDEGTPEEELVYEAPEPSGEQVIDEEVAEEAIRIMEGDIEQGINSNASLGDRPAAGKSGTTDRFFDAWFIGFTPQLATSVWLGYEEGGRTLDEVADGSPVVGTNYPADIWRDYNEVALDGEPIEEFQGDQIPEPETPTRQASGAEAPEPPAEPAAASSSEAAAPPQNGVEGAFPDQATAPQAVPAAAASNPVTGTE
jgi:penicillin-binding protein 1A